jgi:5-methylcytosine-specific restriction protein B
MIYIRNIFTQDLRNGKQIAFTKEPSNIFFEFDFRAQDPERQISFTFKEDDTASSNYKHHNTQINTRLYAASSEARIDSALKVFLIDTLNANIDDIIIFNKRRSITSYELKFIPQSSSNYMFYKSLLNGGNHEVIIEEPLVIKPSEKIEYNFINDFSDWIIQNEGIKHNYLKDSFSSNKENLTEGLKKYEEIYENQFGEKVFSIPKSELENKIDKLEKNLYLEEGDFFDFSSKISNHMPRAILGKKNYLHFLKNHAPTNSKITQIDFNIDQFESNTNNANLKYSNHLITRYISSLATKPFVLLSGLSGSGKTKLAQSFAQWICEDDTQYKVVPVGADWTNREPLLGYVNALDNKEYVLPENGALQLLIEANKVENINKPYFLILDEMNLSHVERYFADFLSVRESRDKFKLHSNKEQEKSGVPFELSWPKNLFVVGTVNIDETTYMFSPKVLDRANAIEFRVTEEEITGFLKSPNQIDLTKLESKGANMAADYIKIVINEEFEDVNTDDLNKTLVNFFVQLQKTGAEFGYRTGMEIHRLYQQLAVINEDISENDKIDIAVMQKLLPKLHGSRRKLCPILETLGNICVNDIDVKKDIFENEDFKLYEEVNGKLVLTEGVLYPLSLEKITRMYMGAIENGFASYAEA